MKILFLKQEDETHMTNKVMWSHYHFYVCAMCVKLTQQRAMFCGNLWIIYHSVKICPFVFRKSTDHETLSIIFDALIKAGASLIVWVSKDSLCFLKIPFKETNFFTASLVLGCAHLTGTMLWSLGLCVYSLLILHWYSLAIDSAVASFCLALASISTFEVTEVGVLTR